VLADGIGAAVWAVGVGTVGYLFAGSVARRTGRFSDAGHWVAVAAFAIVAGAAARLSVRYVLSHRPVAGG
jgi:membrane protein DedA with SNARE-associated domain